MRSTLSLGAMKQPSDLPGRPPKFIDRPPRKHKIKGIQSPGKTGEGFSLPEKEKKKEERKWFRSDLMRYVCLNGDRCDGWRASQEPHYLTRKSNQARSPHPPNYCFFRWSNWSRCCLEIFWILLFRIRYAINFSSYQALRNYNLYIFLKNRL
jgi:hypothetical protein